MNHKLMFSAIFSLLAFSSGLVHADHVSDGDKVVKFMEGLQIDFTNELSGQITGKDLMFHTQTLDCSNVSLGIGVPDGFHGAFNAYVRNSASGVVADAGLNYYDDKLVILELTPTVLRVSNVSNFAGDPYWGKSSYANRAVLEVRKDEAGKLKSFSLKVANGGGESSWFSSTLKDIEKPDMQANCIVGK